jgi:energy-coupling factor transporter ATP-binding protein EcfA2
MPTLTPRPLDASDRDEALFVGRTDELQLALAALRHGLNVLVLGPRGSGRTTFLNACARALRKQEVHHKMLSAAILQSPLDLLDRLAWELDPPREEYDPPEFMRVWDAVKPWEGKRRVLGAPDGVLRAIRLLRHKLEEKQGDAPPNVVLLDDPSPEITHTLFGQARDEIWALPIVWMVSGDKARSGDLLKPPADSFFGRVIELPVLGDEQAETLLRRRAGDELDTATLQRVVQSAQGSPRRLILLASDAVLEAELGTTSTGTIAHERRVDEILDELGLPARRLWDALLPMGQASATDETLLKQLGWSRQRASQVFRQLADAGLVEAAQEQVERGRPRRVYRIAGPKLQ